MKVSTQILVLLRIFFILPQYYAPGKQEDASEFTRLNKKKTHTFRYASFPLCEFGYSKFSSAIFFCSSVNNPLSS